MTLQDKIHARDVPTRDEALNRLLQSIDYLNDCLATCKLLTDNYNVAVREASHQKLHADMMQILNETHQGARDAYNLMFQKGWYKLEAAEQQQLQQAYQQVSCYSTQFPYH